MKLYNNMEINEVNKKLYEDAFIADGEYGYLNDWKPSIDEREIEDLCCDEEGNCVPATPLGYRDYTESRLEGLKNIFLQEESVDLTDDKFHNLTREDNVIKLYDKIKTDKGDFVVVGDDEDKYYLVNEENHLFCVNYVKCYE